MDIMEYIDFEYYKYRIKSRGMQEPVVFHLEMELNEAIDEIYVYENSDEERELLGLLKKLKDICWAHDVVARKEYEPKLHTVPHEVDEDEVYLKLCSIYKSINEPLGATIKSEKYNNSANGTRVVIARILNSGCVDRSKLLKSGDQILEVNGVNTTSLKAQEVLPLLSPTSGVLKMTVEEPITRGNEHLFNYKELSEISNTNCDDVYYARVLFNYKPHFDLLHPCREASLELRAGDILEICDWPSDQQWWQGRLLSSYNQSDSPSLSAILTILNCLTQTNKSVASMIPSKKAEENAIMSVYSENKVVLDLNDVVDNLLFKVELKVNAENENKILFKPNTYEELCIFDPMIQTEHKRPVAIYFELDKKIVSSFKCNNSNSEVFSSGIFEHLNKIARILVTAFDSIDGYAFPGLYLPKATALGTPLLSRKNRDCNLNSPFSKLIEKSSQHVLSKSIWDLERQKSNLVYSVFDELLAYKVNELWKDFLEENDQLIIFPSFENFNYFRNTTPIGKMCFHVLINLNMLETMFNNFNFSPKHSSPFKYQGSLNRKNRKISTSKQSVDDVKHFFDAYVNRTEDLGNALKSYVQKINQMPSFVLK